ncbi:hypothetical protein BC829DRAFT_55576 [Chytridium lagenaria]|nr:hypothetical protein BC829DRAFT_55576 [Chytridium lagenaria]
METKYHFDRNAILHSLRENIFDDIAAIYYLMYFEKEGRTGGVSSGEKPPLSLAPSPPTATVVHEVQSATAALPPPIQRSHPDQGAVQSSDDGVKISESGANGVTPQQPQLRPQARGGVKPRKRRFTVGGEADVQKYADEDEEAAEMLKKLQQQPALVEENASTIAVNSMAPNGATSNVSTFASSRHFFQQDSGS